MIRTLYVIGILFLALILTAGSTLAQPGPGGGNGPGGPAVAGPGDPGPNPVGGRGHRRGFSGIIPPRVVLVRILDLSDEQLAEVQALLEEIRDTLGPIHEEIAMLQEELRAELEMEVPDPLVVGEIVIAIHDLNTEIRSWKEQFREQFRAILTEEQLARLQAFLDAHSPGNDEGEEDGV